MAKVCIICTKEVQKGRAVSDDAVIRFIRRAKQSLKIAKNNELVVCEDDLEAHRKKRQAYERNLAVYMVIAGIVVVLLVFLPILTAGFSLYAMAVGVLFAALLVLLPVITSHTPSLAQPYIEQEKPAAEKPSVKKPAVKKQAERKQARKRK